MQHAFCTAESAVQTLNFRAWVHFSERALPVRNFNTKKHSRRFRSALASQSNASKQVHSSLSINFVDLINYRPRTIVSREWVEKRCSQRNLLRMSATISKRAKENEREKHFAFLPVCLCDNLLNSPFCLFRFLFSFLVREGSFPNSRISSELEFAK